MSTVSPLSSTTSRYYVHREYPRVPLESLALPKQVHFTVGEIVAEHVNASRLLEEGMLPRNRILLVGPPGNGKHSLAGAMAMALQLPLLVADCFDLAIDSPQDIVLTLSQPDPCVLLFKTIDELGVRSLKTLMGALASLYSESIFVSTVSAAAADIPWQHFDVRLSVPIPDDAMRYDYIERRFRDMGIALSADTINDVSLRLTSSNVADVENFLRCFRRASILHPEKTCEEILLTVLYQWA